MAFTLHLAVKVGGGGKYRRAVPLQPTHFSFSRTARFSLEQQRDYVSSFFAESTLPLKYIGVNRPHIN